MGVLHDDETLGGESFETMKTELTYPKRPIPPHGTATHGAATAAPAYSNLMKCAAMGDEKGLLALLARIQACRDRANDREIEREAETAAPGRRGGDDDEDGGGAAEAHGWRRPPTTGGEHGGTVEVVEEKEEDEDPEAAAEDLFATDKKGRTALDWARLGRHRGCAQALEAAMAEDINRRRLQFERREGRMKLQGMIKRNATARRSLMAAIDAHRNADVHTLLESVATIRDGVPPLTREAFVKAARLLLPDKEARRREPFWLDVESPINGNVVVMATTCSDLPLLKKLVDKQ